MVCRLLVLACVGIFLPLVSSQIYPKKYTLLSSEIVSANGSTLDGHCTNATNIGSPAMVECTEPEANSFLFDKVIPVLTELDGNGWASSLLTLNTSASSANITFDFTDTQNYNGVPSIEVVMFNCPQWGIGTSGITIVAGNLFAGTINSATTSSCDSLVRVCTSQISTSVKLITLQFNLDDNSNLVYIADVAFFGSSARMCEPDAILNPPTTPLTPMITSPIMTTSPITIAPPIVSIPSTTSSMTTSGSDTLTSTTSSRNPNTPSPSKKSPMTVIVAVIVSLLVVTVVAIIIVVTLLLLRFRKQKKSGGYNNNVYMQVGEVNSNNNTIPNGKPGKSVYEDIDIDSKNPTDSTPSKDENRNLYEEVGSRKPRYGKSKPSDVIVNTDGADYSTIDIDGNPDLYDTLNRGHAAENDNSNSTYSKIDNQGDIAQSSANANRSSTSPSHTYASVKIQNQRPTKPACSQDLESDEEAPSFPEKTQELQQYLDIKLLDVAPQDNNDADVANDIYTVPTLSISKISSLKGSVLSAGSLNTNPLYFSVETETGASATETIVTDNVYAEPGVSIAADACKFLSMDNIYESIYSEPLQPSHFLQEPESAGNMNDLCPYSSIYTVPVITTTQEKALEVTMENIREELTLGSGNFGNVILAKTIGLSQSDLKIGSSTDKTISVLVAVKMLKVDAGECTKKQFEKEHCFMFRLNHPNVIRLLGICMTDTPFIMMEYMKEGDLNQILQHQYHAMVDDETIPGEGEITHKILIHISTQIASGMNYLASKNFIHRDLATRNCLVGEDFLVKVSDFGMSRSLYESHYYILRGRAILPIRWMATECFYGKFSAKTDVWAFGITMWEIFMLTKVEPYHEMSDQDLVQNALNGPERLLLPCPEGCPRSVYEIMKSCWAHEASQRATFEQLHEKLSLL